MGRLIYISHTHPDITYAVSVESQFMHDPHNLESMYRILQYLNEQQEKGFFS